ncbi:MAG: CHASE2 domain-containing protein [Elainellaceae cyanobacterium]
MKISKNHLDNRSMNHLVVLNLGNGDWHQGCPTVIAQLWHAGQAAPVQWMGALPPLPELGDLLEAWRRNYEALYAHLGWRRQTTRMGFEIDEEDVTHLSTAEFDQLCRQVRHTLNDWLQAASFRSIDQALRTHLPPTDEIRLIITAQNQALLRLPWHLWQFFDDYPQAEPAVSLPTYGRAMKTSSSRPQIHILVILGDAAGIDVMRDRTLLESLPHAAVTVLVEPDRATLNQHLWEAEWDLLFFAGHSSSQFHAQRPQGCLRLNQRDALNLEDLRYGLKRAIAHGLKLAIFNSCDGLGLAWDLADLHIPQVIVMREPVPDSVAQTFLQRLLAALVQGQSLYGAVRLAREQLQGLEDAFPCATWLPVIYQNPAEAATAWDGWRGEFVGASRSATPDLEAIAQLQEPLRPNAATPPAALPSPSRQLVRGMLTSLAVAGLVLGGRALGLLQPLELWAFDRLQNLRPAEAVDDRFLVVTLDEADIQAHSAGNGSLSDQAFSEVLERLQAHRPRVIGLDLYRDRPTDAQLTTVVQALQADDRLIVVCKSRDAVFDPVGIAPPPEVPANRVGFSDFLEDGDGVLRRQIVAMNPEPASPCTTPYSFSSRLAFRYLEAAGITPRFTPQGNLQLGDTVLQRVRPYWGGYQGIDAAGNQLMLNYRALPPHQIAPKITLSQLLAGQVAPEAIRDRIVLIGVTAKSAGDYWLTPFGSSRADRLAGVFVQTHMTSQLLSAALDQRPILWVWPLWGEAIWLVVWSLAGYGVMRLKPLPRRSLMLIVALGGLIGSCFGLLLLGGWMPLVPGAIAILLAAGLAYTNGLGSNRIPR